MIKITPSTSVIIVNGLAGSGLKPTIKSGSLAWESIFTSATSVTSLRDRSNSGPAPERKRSAYSAKNDHHELGRHSYQDLSALAVLHRQGFFFANPIMRCSWSADVSS